MASSSPLASSPAGSSGGGGGGGSPTTVSRRKCSPDRSGGTSRKSSGSREFGSSILNSVNKSTSQFKKTIHCRSGSPINWFPRKKTESYLKRKIKRLQEIDGMHASLHETLGNANPHYTRMAREKIAAREAASKAMEARKVAMVEASWCRILQAARIQSRKAEEVMEKAKLCATEAFEEARAMGVMMYDRPDCPRQQYEVESSSRIGGQSTHKFTASFQTAFEVDKEVAAALKKAFVRLANSPGSSNKEEFKELLWKISQNPDTTETDVDSEAVSLPEIEQLPGDSKFEETKSLKVNEENFRSSLFPSNINTTKVQQSTELVNTMLERLKALHEDELASLAVIVATSGLNAALQTDRDEHHEMESMNSIAAGSLSSKSRRYSTAASFMDMHGPKKEVTAELPSLDKFLVRHLSKLEREVQEAKEASRKDAPSAKSVAQDVQGQLAGSNAKTPEFASDLGSILVKHVSKLEKEILEAKKNNISIHPLKAGCKDVKVNVKTDLQASDAESEFNNAKSEIVPNCNLKGAFRGSDEDSNHVHDSSSNQAQEDKENKVINSHQLPPIGAKGNYAGRRLTRLEAAKLEALKSFCTQDSNTLDVGLDKVLVKPIHFLETEKKKALEAAQINVQKDQRKLGNKMTASESLDKILVKHVSRLEREKMESEKRNALEKGQTNVQNDQRKHGNTATASESLDQTLVKHVSRHEREKMENEKRNAFEQGHSNVQNDQQKHSNNSTTSESLDQILVKHVSRLEREKMEHAKKGDLTMVKKSNAQLSGGTIGCLGDIFVKHLSKLEQAKLGAAAEEKLTGSFNPVEECRRARERELLDAWGGMGLGNSMKPHLSKIERDKAAWREAEEEQKQICTTGEL